MRMHSHCIWVHSVFVRMLRCVPSSTDSLDNRGDIAMPRAVALKIENISLFGDGGDGAQRPECKVGFAESGRVDQSGPMQTHCTLNHCGNCWMNIIWITVSSSRFPLSKWWPSVLIVDQLCLFELSVAARSLLMDAVCVHSGGRRGGIQIWYLWQGRHSDIDHAIHRKSRDTRSCRHSWRCNPLKQTSSQCDKN